MRTPRLASLAVGLALAAAPAPALAVGSWLTEDAVEATTTARPDQTPTPEHPSGPPRRRPLAPLALTDHDLDVRILDGFARTEVTQEWENPNPVDLEATYRLPLPKDASLSEVTLRTGEVVLDGEVLEKDAAEKAYGEEKEKGNDAGLAGKDEYRSFDFRVARVRAGDRVRVRLVYYQPLKVDTGVVRYHYPVEPGGDEEGAGFWSGNVRGQVPVQLRARIRSAWSVEQVRVPKVPGGLSVTRGEQGVVTAEGEVPAGRDVVLYYRLKGDVPGRVEVHAYRPETGGPGTFMAVLTPGLDLPPVDETGADHVFLLDVSGSMSDQIARLREGVAEALPVLGPRDRFRIFEFSGGLREQTSGWVQATPEGIAEGQSLVRRLRTRGSTALFEALEGTLPALDRERATNLILVTDGVANQGPTDRASFRRLLEETDLRIQAFLMGNQANWPLMDTVTRASGGTYRAVSSSDDLKGVLVLAHARIASEALHDVHLSWSGAAVRDVTDAPRRVFHGEQLIVLGRYDAPGRRDLRIDLRVSGKARSYTAEVELPEVAEDLPELERLWAMARVEDLDRARDEGRLAAGEAEREIVRLGVGMQIVTDETSMVLLTDEGFSSRGIERRNRERVQVEAQARARRAARPAPRRTAKVRSPSPSRSWSRPAPSVSRRRSWSFGGGRGGGALDPGTGLLVVGLGVLGFRRKEEEE